MAIGVRIEGLLALEDMLKEHLPNEAHNLLRAAIYKTAQGVAEEIKGSTPVRTGNLRLSIKAKRLKGNRTTVASDVVFTSGPLVKHDGFYWRFLENGTVNRPATPFVAPVVTRLEAAIPAILRKEVGTALEKRLARRAKRAAKL